VLRVASRDGWRQFRLGRARLPPRHRARAGPCWPATTRRRGCGTPCATFQSLIEGLTPLPLMSMTRNSWWRSGPRRRGRALRWERARWWAAPIAGRHGVGEESRFIRAEIRAGRIIRSPRAAAHAQEETPPSTLGGRSPIAPLRDCRRLRVLLLMHHSRTSPTLQAARGGEGSAQRASASTSWGSQPRTAQPLTPSFTRRTSSSATESCRAASEGLGRGSPLAPDRMTRMIDDMLDFARTAWRRFPIHPAGRTAAALRAVVEGAEFAYTR